jgi:hypothetical protein
VRTQVFVVTTAFGLATVATALAEGLFDDGHFNDGHSNDGQVHDGIFARREDHAPVRRVLVVCSTTEMPEAAPGLLTVAGAAQLASRFDAVYDLNELIDPLHPSGWRPREIDLPVWQRHLQLSWGLTGDVRLVVESIQADPALAVCRILADARIDVYADGLMSYGPTRNPLPDSVGARIERLLHLDLVPGLMPLLLADWQVPTVIIPVRAFRTVIAAMTPDHRVDEPDRVTLVLGQYLAAAELLTEAEETALYIEMVVTAGRANGRPVVFKPHPSAPRSQQLALRQAADVTGVDLRIATDAELAESWFARGGVGLVVGCFSTALLTAATAYGLPVARLGTELLLDRMTPYQNSNRIPATLVDALVSDLRAGTQSLSPPELTPDITALVVAVGYVMQPVRYANRRAEAVDFLTRSPDSRTRYVKRQRLTRLSLPGTLPPPRPVRRRVRRALRRVTRLVGSQGEGAAGHG